MKADLARLNHVLIPATRSAHDRYRNGPLGRALRHIGWPFARLTREGRTLFVLACAAVIFSMDPRTESHVLVVATLSLLVASLFFTGAFRLNGVTGEPRALARIAVGDELTITVSLRNEGTAEHRAIRVETPRLPWDGTWTAAPADIAKLAPGAMVHAEARARFVARGQHHIDPFHAVALLPLRLSKGAPVRIEGVRFVVVPKIARVISLATPLNRRHQPGGIAQASRTGDATDLVGVRPYRPGDPVRDLHARLWARHGTPVVREYQEEYFTRIGVVVDTDPSAASPAHLEAALSLAAGVIARLGSGDALVDLLVVGEDARPIAVGRSLGSIDRALDVLAAVGPGPRFSGDRVLARLGAHLERLSSIVLVLLAWDDGRAALASAIRARGAGCRVLIVGDCASRALDATTVPVAAIVKGEALSLG